MVMMVIARKRCDINAIYIRFQIGDEGDAGDALVAAADSA